MEWWWQFSVLIAGVTGNEYFMCARHCVTSYSYEMGIFIYLLEIGILRLEGTKQFAQPHTASNMQSQELKPFLFESGFYGIKQYSLLPSYCVCLCTCHKIIRCLQRSGSLNCFLNTCKTFQCHFRYYFFPLVCKQLLPECWSL